MTGKELQELLRARGITQSALAREAGVHPSTISLFLRRKFKSRRLAELVNEKLGMTSGLR